MEEPGRLQSMGSLRVRHNWATSLSLFTFMHCRRKWQPTPVFLPGESQGRGPVSGVAQSRTRLKRLSSSSRETDLRKQWYDLWQRMVCLYSLLVLSSRVLYLSLSGILSLFLCMVWGSVLTSLIYMWLSSFPNTTCWRDYLFSIVYSCLLCQRLIDLKYVGLFLGSVFCSLDPYVYFCANTMLFCLPLLCGNLWILGWWYLQLSSFSSGLLWKFWVFYGSI